MKMTYPVGGNGFFRGSGGGRVLQLEALRQLEVQLNRRTLMVTPQSVGHLDVDLGTVKGTVWKHAIVHILNKIKPLVKTSI